MTEYNNREKLIKLLTGRSLDTEEDVEYVVDILIAADVVEVVRCKDCKYRCPEDKQCDHFMSTILPVSRRDNDFCSYGERRSE